MFTSGIKGNISDITVEKSNICHFDHCQRTKFYGPGLECQLGNKENEEKTDEKLEEKHILHIWKVDIHSSRS